MNDYLLEKENDELAGNSIHFFLYTLVPENPFIVAHAHSALEILFITEGELQVRTDDRIFPAHPGDTVLFRSGSVHWLHALGNKTARYYVLKIRASFVQDISFRKYGMQHLMNLSLTGGGQKCLWNAAESEKTGITAALSALIRENQEKGYCSDIAVKLCAGAILLAVLRDTEPVDSRRIDIENEDTARRIYATINYINNHYAESITAQECSEQAYMSYSYFSRSFRKVTGKSFPEYLNAVRISYADKMLLSEDKSVSDIAAECGFNTVSHFIATYKKLRGMTPLEFRTANK